MGQYNNSIFGISFQDSNLINVESKFNLERNMDDGYDDTTFYISNEVYHHDQDPNFKFDYMYGIEAYRYEDEKDHSVKTFYTLYMIPTFNSLSKNKQNDVIKRMPWLCHLISHAHSRTLCHGTHTKNEDVKDRMANPYPSDYHIAN